ncbi:acetyl-CoA carboxylase biotin carboxyl carrier protein [Asticcacaulis sp. DW145]|jgi:acetyl-CoA carboxylase biotin carboxyl carrier protein|uniref:Biotin carboxyl carrier protein of acetyl-CoA carboxylase n=1 Tax=Asticcacaulis currens TaxID=2984210 RepID=A0ABT5IGF8_9CAUL|nr:acetyl-CoA carboxylase biotin carboxyl carrier protein [Asticcacaulis currens]MDC7695271.1 acetyl-CoA carboxylase biotin carboxyl carrier protein [Asticcacaulis currens]BEV12516.1 acetyl-CoA carboxylase biotin carboxyl carrier protein [Asticcacaulis sp. DW145]
MSSQKPVDPIDPRLIRKLADILKETELTEIEVEQGELKIRVARTLTAAPVAAPLTTYAAPVAAPAPVAAAAAPVAAPAAAEAPKAAKDALKSPMVGTVYLSPQPGAATFVKVGDKVKAGQTLLIIEAMKTMNPIPAPKDGTVSEILVSDAQPVEFGEGLVVID